MKIFVVFMLCLLHFVNFVVSDDVEKILFPDDEELLKISVNGKLKVEDNFERRIPGQTSSGIERVRQRRAVRYSTVTFINKSGMEVNVFYMDQRGYRQYYFTLRLNERMVIHSKVGTTWLAYDKQNRYDMRLNNRYNFLVLHKHLGKKLSVVITTRPNVKPSPRSNVFSEKFIEVMVIADSTVVKKRGKGTEKYILTLMNAVNRLFQDKSFGLKLQIVVTRIELLEKDPASLKIIAGAPKNSMRNACLFASTYNHHSEYHENHFDFAIVMTRKRYGYSGYTPIYRMCDKELGCTLVLERGFENAHVIAHEIGHSLGIDHDGENNKCLKDGRKGSLMAPTLWSRFDSYYWSECSRRQIKETIRYFTCLNDRPQKNITKYNTNLPGVHYNLDEQCAFYLGSQYRGCKGFYYRWGCRYLHCTPYWLSSRRHCIRYHLPPMDGTRCKYGKDWCVKGNCFPEGMFNHRPIHGGWSGWGSWGSCSSTCGVGIRKRLRKCTNPSPKYNGRKCEGSSKDVKICNIKSCEVEKMTKDKRDEHCKSFGKGQMHWFSPSQMVDSVASIDALNCTFDDAYNCSWSQDVNDQFDWVKHKGSTPSMGTGPSRDHTLANDEGHYMFIEASDGQDRDRRLKGYKARLISPTISVPEVCFSFYYHMLGSHIGALNIRKRFGNKEVLLWSRTRDVEDAWFFANVSIKSEQAFKIVIEAVRGSHYQGDIAVDDLSVTAGSCMGEKPKGNTSCQITCTNPSITTFKSGAILPDTFSCHEDNYTGICLDGECKRLGCDMKFGSNKSMDDCQICGGDGSSCALSEGNTNVTLNGEETTLMTIPPGSTKLNFVIFAASDAVMGLKQSTNEVFFPKKNEEDHPEPFYTKFMGCTYRFEKSSGNGAVVVESQGRTNGIVQLVISGAKQASVDMKYQLFMPSFHYEWKKKKPTNCRGNCTNYDYVCIQMPSGLESENINCPPNSTFCVGDHCIRRYSWYKSYWSSCSRTCGTAIKTRTVNCRLVLDDEVSSASMIVDDSKCEEKKPNMAVYCRNSKCKIKAKRCREKSPLCGMYKTRGFCRYSNVKRLCCKTCA